MSKRTLNLIIETYGPDSKEAKEATRKFKQELESKTNAAIAFYMMLMNMN